MALTDRDYMRETEEQESQSLFQRINAFGERHAKIILFISAVLIILAVLIIADSFWRRSQFERGLVELDGATTAEELEAVREKYKKSDILMPRILYRLANAIHQEAAAAPEGFEHISEGLLKADKIYQEFLNRFPEDPLRLEVEKAQMTLSLNLKFINSQQQALLKMSTLMTHPLNTAGRKDSPIRFGPIHEPNPTLEFLFPENKRIAVELFEEEAPNTVANFIELCEQKYFDGLAFVKKEDTRLETEAKPERAVNYALAYEETSRKYEAGSLVMLRQTEGGPNRGAEFAILLYARPNRTEGTLFGQVKPESLMLLRTLQPDEALETILITTKRDHAYTAEKITP